MEIGQAINQLFEEVVAQAETQTVEMTASNKIIPFEINLDDHGNGHYETDVTGLAFKITKRINAVIKSPEGIFNIHVISSAGTDASFNSIHTGQPISCKIAIKGKTLITIDVNSNIPNNTLRGELSY